MKISKTATAVGVVLVGLVLGIGFAKVHWGSHKTAATVKGGLFTVLGASGPTLAWDPNPAQDHVTGYNVYIDTNPPNGTPANSPKIATVTTTSYPLGTTPPGSTTYFVTAFNSTNESPPSNEVSLLGVPHAPTNLTLQ